MYNFLIGFGFLIDLICNFNDFLDREIVNNLLKMKPTRHQDKMADVEKTWKKQTEVFESFWCIGSGMLNPISVKNQSQVNGKIDDKTDCPSDRFLDKYLMILRASLASKTDANLLKSIYKSIQQLIRFGIFGSSWVGFGGQVVSKINQNWSQSRHGR